MSEGTSDHATYRAMSLPFADQAAAEEAMVAFRKDLREIRIKHRIADVYLIVAVSAMVSETEEGEFLTAAALGDVSKSERMLAYCLGRAQADREAEIARLLKGRTAPRQPKLDV